MSLPSARTHVHGMTGHVERAGAEARFAARRAGQVGLAVSKVVLWLLVVTSSLVAIALLAARGARYHPSDLDRSLHERDTRLRQLELSRRAIEIDQAQLEALLRASRELEIPPYALAPSLEIHPAPTR